MTANHRTHSPDFLEGALCTNLEPLVWLNFLYYKKRKDKERLRYLHQPYRKSTAVRTRKAERVDSGEKWCSNIYVYELLDSVLDTFCYAHTGSYLMLLSTLGISFTTIPNFQIETLHFGEIRLLLRVPLLVMIELDSI